MAGEAIRISAAMGRRFKAGQSRGLRGNFRYGRRTPCTIIWSARIDAVLEEATLARPADAVFPWHGKRGVHTEHLGYLLAEMQFLQRAYPGAEW